MEQMTANFNTEEAGDLRATIQYRLTGEDGGDWVVTIRDGHCTSEPGTVPDPDLTITVRARDYKDILSGRLKPQQARTFGILRIKGNMTLYRRLPTLFPNQ